MVNDMIRKFAILLLVAIPICSSTCDAARPQGQQEIEKLFGQYTITGYKRYGGGLTTEAEERGKIGKTVYIGKDKYIYIDKTLKNPVYRLEHIKVDFGEGNIVPRDTSIFYGIEDERKTVDRLLVFANLSAAKDDDQWADGLEILSGGRLLDMDDGFFLFLEKKQAK